MKRRLAAAALCISSAAFGAPDPTAAALADLGLAMLRQSGSAPNAVVSPLATAAALGMVHAGTAGAGEREIEALFGGRGTGAPFKQRLPALLKQLGGGTPSPFVMAGRVWLDPTVAPTVPAGFTQRLAQRYGADAQQVPFKNDAEGVRVQINNWTAKQTDGRIAELLPTGSVSSSTQVALTAAVHFRSAWDKPFDAALTETRPFAGASQPVPTLSDDRAVMQARVGPAQVYALPFAGAAYALLLAVPGEGSSIDALLQTLNGSELARWQTALQPQRCALALPKFNIAPKATALKPMLEKLGVKTVFTTAADLRPMLGKGARGVHLDDVHHAAGITIDEKGGEAAAAAAATFQPKSLALPAPPCAVDRAFLFAVVHQASGTPLFLGRVGDPSAAP